MADIPIKWAVPIVGLQSYLNTHMNAQGNGIIKTGATINNESNLATHMDLELKLVSLDLSAQTSPVVVVYLFESIDGGSSFDTNEDGVSADSDIPTPDKIIVQFGLRIDTGAEAKVAIQSLIPIPPGQFTMGLRNSTGIAFGATSNTLKYRTYSLKAVTA